MRKENVIPPKLQVPRATSEGKRVFLPCSERTLWVYLSRKQIMSTGNSVQAPTPCPRPSCQDIQTHSYIRNLRRHVPFSQDSPDHVLKHIFMEKEFYFTRTNTASGHFSPGQSRQNTPVTVALTDPTGTHREHSSAFTAPQMLNQESQSESEKHRFLL